MITKPGITAPTGRKKPAQGKVAATAADAALGRASQNTSIPERAKDGDNIRAVSNNGKNRILWPLPKTWSWSTIGQLTEVIRGASPRPKGDPRYFGGNVPWIMIADVTRQPGKYLYKTRESVTEAGAALSRKIQAGELILSNSATVCVPKILKVDGCIHDGFVAFPTLKERVNLDFAYYWFEFVRPTMIQENRQGVTQVNLNTGIVREMHFPLPPFPEQRRIVSEIEKQFTRMEAGVAALRRVQANLKRYRAAVLKAACEGKLADVDRTNWQMRQLGQLVKIRYGKMLPTKEFSESGFPVFGANGIIGHHTRYLYEAEQVLISCRGAYSGKINLSPPKCYITNNSLVLEMPESSRVEKRFLFYMLQAADKSKLVTGSAQPQVTINNAELLDVPVPSLAEQTRIVAEVERRLSVVEELESVVSADLQRATRLRQSILQKAFTGEL